MNRDTERWHERALTEAREATKQAQAGVEKAKAELELVIARAGSVDLETSDARAHELRMVQEQEATKRLLVLCLSVVVMVLTGMVAW